MPGGARRPVAACGNGLDALKKPLLDCSMLDCSMLDCSMLDSGWLLADWLAVWLLDEVLVNDDEHDRI